MAKSDLEIKEEFDKQIQDASQVIKKYIDEQDVITRAGLADEVVARLSGDDSLASHLERVQALADAFISVFDEDADGKITKEEILLKLAENNQTVADLVTKIAQVENDIASLKVETSANKTAISGNTQSIASLDLAVQQVRNDYLTRDGAYAIFADTVSVVNGVFYPAADDNNGLNG